MIGEWGLGKPNSSKATPSRFPSRPPAWICSCRTGGCTAPRPRSSGGGGGALPAPRRPAGRLHDHPRSILAPPVARPARPRRLWAWWDRGGSSALARRRAPRRHDCRELRPLRLLRGSEAVMNAATPCSCSRWPRGSARGDVRSDALAQERLSPPPPWSPLPRTMSSSASRQCCLSTDAGVPRSPIARRLTPESRPSWSPRCDAGDGSVSRIATLRARHSTPSLTGDRSSERARMFSRRSHRGTIKTLRRRISPVAPVGLAGSCPSHVAASG
jgi:hypothetical protein